MGISGLLPFLKGATTTINIKQYEGSTVAIDTYCWIYRGAFSCAEDLALGHPTDGHVKYVLKYVRKLLEWGIKPIMVFDGSCLPSKKNTELKRRESKEMYRRKAAQCLAEGRTNEARECFQRCIECTPKMALDVIKALHEIGVDVLVAPYEADAQLTYLNKIGAAQLIITEDSDLVLFGCEKILYKLDMNGTAQLVEKEKIVSITQFDSANNFERFRWMCILSGCDYLENLPGIGLGKARKFLKSIQKIDLDQILRQIPKALKMPNLAITNEYVESFKRADKTFKYQIVFDPLLRRLKSLHDYGSDICENDDISFAGIFYDDDQALQHSLGNLDVNSHVKVYSFDPDKWNYKPPPKYSNNPPVHMLSIWFKKYRPFKSSTPFSAFKTTITTTKSMAASINRPVTVGITKTLSNSSSLKRERTDIMGFTATYTKRKNEDIASLEDDDRDKRFKQEDLIDDMLSQYSNETESKRDESDTDLDASQTATSSYFSKSSTDSPVLTKSTQKLKLSSQRSINKLDELEPMKSMSPLKSRRRVIIDQLDSLGEYIKPNDGDNEANKTDSADEENKENDKRTKTVLSDLNRFQRSKCTFTSSVSFGASLNTNVKNSSLNNHLSTKQDGEEIEKETEKAVQKVEQKEICENILSNSTESSTCTLNGDLKNQKEFLTECIVLDDEQTKTIQTLKSQTSSQKHMVSAKSTKQVKSCKTDKTTPLITSYFSQFAFTKTTYLGNS